MDGPNRSPCSKVQIRLGQGTDHLELSSTIFRHHTITLLIITSLLTMQHPRSLVLLGAVSSLTAAAAGSLPRGVGPECKLDALD